MCGIVHVKRKDDKDALKMTWKRYISQKNRGTQGFGYVAVRKDKIMSVGRSALEKEIDDQIHKEENIDEVLFHHRFPTSTPNFAEATHPIFVSNDLLDYDYYVVHNGVITNDTKQKEEYDEMGFIFTTNIRHEYITRGTTYFDEQFNDSEAFAIDLALTLENKKPDMTSEGNIAFIAYQVNKKIGKVIRTFWGRNSGNPLVIDDNKAFISITSEGNGKVVEPDMLFCLDHITGYTTHEDKKIGKSYSDYYAKNSYKYKKEDDYSGYHDHRIGGNVGFAGKWADEDDDDTTLGIPEADTQDMLDDREKYLEIADFELFYGGSSLSMLPTDFTQADMIKLYEEKAYLEDEMQISMQNSDYDTGQAILDLIDMVDMRIVKVEKYYDDLELSQAISKGSVKSVCSQELDEIANKATQLLFPENKNKKDGK